MKTTKHELNREYIDYAYSLVKTYSDATYQADKQLLNWLFTVQGVGIAGLLTIRESIEKVQLCKINWALFVLSGGLILLLVYATIMRYWLNAKSDRATKNYDKLLDDRDWDAFIQKAHSESEENRLAEVIVWVSGLCIPAAFILTALAFS